MKKLFLTFVVLIFSMSFLFSQTTKWEVPSKYKTMKSTVNLKDQTVVNNGKDLWAKNCKSCHGSKGLGDGPKAAMLKTNPGNFSTTQFKSQSDGEIYYKTVYGRGEMPNYEKKIPNQVDQWSLVSYMRTF